MNERANRCCLCGAVRRPTQAPLGSFGNDQRVVHIGEHRPLQDGRWENKPQLIVNVSIYRNGGTAPGQTHICDECIVVGLQHAKQFVDQSLAALAEQVSA